MKQTIFEYRVVGHRQVGKRKNLEWESTVLTEGEILAYNQKDVEIFIYRELDQDDLDEYGLENIDIYVRKFASAAPILSQGGSSVNGTNGTCLFTKTGQDTWTSNCTISF